VDVINMAVHIHLISNDMIPEPPLPDRTPIQTLPLAAQGGKRQLQSPDNPRQVPIDDHMEMVRENPPRDRLKPNPVLHASHGLPQEVAVFNQQGRSTMRHPRYEVHLPRAVVAE